MGEPAEDLDGETGGETPRRPATWGECQALGLGTAGSPCPFASCRHSLLTDSRNGQVVDLFGEGEGEGRPTCSLREAARGGQGLQEIGQALGLTRERVRQVETQALRKVARVFGLRKAAGRPKRRTFEPEDACAGLQELARALKQAARNTKRLAPAGRRLTVAEVFKAFPGVCVSGDYGATREEGVSVENGCTLATPEGGEAKKANGCAGVRG